MPPGPSPLVPENLHRAKPPVNLVSDGYKWLVHHLKSLATAVGLLTTSMVFVMIMPLIELVVVGVKAAKIPIRLWMNSARRAKQRTEELKKELM